MTTSTSSRFAPARAAIPLVLALAVIAILLRFPPDQFSFYPQCPLHRAFGILCPGCGTTRAFASLLHGRITEALCLNALTTLLVPVAAAYAIAASTRLLLRKPLRLPQPPRPAIYATLAAATLFTIARNL